MKNKFDMKCTTKAVIVTAMAVGLGICSNAIADDISASSSFDAVQADEAKKLQLQLDPPSSGISDGVNRSVDIKVLDPMGSPQPIQPSNDLCDNAILIECGSKTIGSTANATYNAAGTCGTTHTAPETWYRLVGTGGQIEVTTCNNEVGFGYDTKLTVWTGSCGSLVCVGGNDDSACSHSGLLSRVTFDSVAGQDYYVMVHGFSSGVGDYGLNVICESPPPPGCPGDVDGDGFVGPSDLIALLDSWGPCPVNPGLPGSCVGSCGTQSPDGCWCDESCCTFEDCCEDKTAVCGGCSIPAPECPGDLNGDGVVDWFDLLIVLGDWGCFEGFPPCGDPEAGNCCVANGTPNCDNEQCCNAVCALDSYCCEVEWDSICAGIANDICSICDVNDTCVQAIPLECDSKTLGSTLQATYNPAGTCGTSHTAPEVWYTLIGTGGQIEVTTCNDDVGFGYDTKLTVWTGTCDQLVCVGGNDDAPCPHSGLLSRVTFSSVEGQTYYIMVHGFSAGIGNFGLNVNCLEPPEPLECPDGAIQENEPCGADVNGGCNADPPAFHFVNHGDVICGNVWATGGTRDTDWYRVTVGPSGTVSGTLTAIAPQVVFIVNANWANCTGIAVVGTTGHSQDGNPGMATAGGLTPGSEVVVFTATGTVGGGGIFEGFPCGSGPGGGEWEYVLQISAP